ncbi:MAG: outer membrane protein assembly factor BamE [bacterium]|nr:MAG: outer membrane protein assembly factor BamE [bacterium]
MKSQSIRLLVAELTLIYILVGCGPSNREKLNLLEVGMTKEKVLEIMGQPYQREAEGNSEWLLYETGPRIRGNPFGDYYERRPDSEWLTPLFIQDGKLEGWGRNFWMTKEKRYDVKIDQTIKQK